MSYFRILTTGSQYHYRQQQETSCYTQTKPTQLPILEVTSSSSTSSSSSSSSSDNAIIKSSHEKSQNDIIYDLITNNEVNDTDTTSLITFLKNLHEPLRLYDGPKRALAIRKPPRGEIRFRLSDSFLRLDPNKISLRAQRRPF